jgi:S-(hydroxymethyl)glutathione dehydrogenase/alcohol dehydrogenase
VKVSACGVCHTDLHVMKAEVAFPTPAVMGHEISGTVAALGPGVTGSRGWNKGRFRVHHAVRLLPAVRAGRDDLCDSFFAMNRLKGTLYDGTTRLRRQNGTPIAMYSMAGLAEYSVVPATDVFPLADGLPLEESAVLGCAIFTAYGACVMPATSAAASASRSSRRRSSASTSFRSRRRSAPRRSSPST